MSRKEHQMNGCHDLILNLLQHYLVSQSHTWVCLRQTESVWMVMKQASTCRQKNYHAIHPASCGAAECWSDWLLPGQACQTEAGPQAQHGIMNSCCSTVPAVPAAVCPRLSGREGRIKMKSLCHLGPLPASQMCPRRPALQCTQLQLDKQGGHKGRMCAHVQGCQQTGEDPQCRNVQADLASVCFLLLQPTCLAPFPRCVQLQHLYTVRQMCTSSLTSGAARKLVSFVLLRLACQCRTVSGWPSGSSLVKN